MRRTSSLPLAPLALCLLSTVVALPLSPRAAFAEGDKTAADEHLIAGTKAFEDSDYAKAVEELQKSVASKPSAKAYLLLGNAYVKTAQLEDAKSAFERVLQLDPKSKKRATVERLIKSLGVLASTKLKISSSPAGATVYVDLKAEGAKGKTPVDVGVTPGPHRVILELDGYERLSIPGAVAVEGKDVPVSGALKLKGCEVTFASLLPEGLVTSVKMDKVAVTERSMRVAAGEHQLELGGAGLIATRKNLTCVADKDNKFKPIVIEERLEVASTGLLALRAPVGATVKIDGRPTSLAEAAALKLSPGEHRVDIEAEGKAPWRVVTQVRAGEQTELRPELDVGGGKDTGITLHEAPRKCSSSIDGRPVENDELRPVPPGSHQVEVRCAGYYPYQRTVATKIGSNLHLDVRPEQRGRVPLYFGVAALVLAAGAEAAAIAGHVKAGSEVAKSPGWQRWNDLEVAGQVLAGVFAAAAIGGIVYYVVLQTRRPGEAARTARAPRRVTLNGSATATSQGGGVLLLGSF